MNKKLSFAKSFIIIVSVIFAFQGCDPKPKQRVNTTPFAVVRGSELRSDLFKLPLEEKDIGKLLKYVKDGGDRKGVGPVDFYDKEFYTGLLNLLTADMDNDKKFELEDLFDNVDTENQSLKENAKKFFVRPIVSSIIDSRLKRPSLRDDSPFALKDKDGNMWWIFYPQKGERSTIEFVMATVPIIRGIVHFKK
jgi:hypothetical protein